MDILLYIMLVLSIPLIGVIGFFLAPVILIVGIGLFVIAVIALAIYGALHDSGSTGE